MKHIVQVRDLCENYRHSLFGYVCVELETGDIKYYTHYDNDGIYRSNMYYEFDINNPNTDILKLCIFLCDYKRESYSEMLPKELESVVTSSLEKHYDFCLKNGYPTEIFDFNRKNLAYEYERGFSLLRRNRFSGQYTPVENVIALSVTENEWQEGPIEYKKKFKDASLHEAGHMKVSDAKLNKEKNEIYIRTGFYTSVYSFEPILLSNGDVFLKFIDNRDLSTTSKEIILEEIMNEYECELIDPTYTKSYPDYGKELNNLCDGKLSLARYTRGIDVYYEIMTSIIPKKWLADTLLDCIYYTHQSNGMGEQINNEDTMKLIREYTEAKRKKHR